MPDIHLPTRQPRLQRWIQLGVLLLANLLVAGVCVASLLHSRTQYEARSLTLTGNVASALEESITSNIEKVDLSLQACVDEVERQLAAGGVNKPALGAYLARRHQALNSSIEVIFVSAADGQGVVSDRIGDLSRFNFADRSYFLAARGDTHHQLQISEPLRSRTTGKDVLVLARRVDGPDGHFAGVVSTEITVAYFAQLMSGFELGSKGTMALRDNGLRLIARYPVITGVEAGRTGSQFISPEYQHFLTASAASGNFYTPLGNQGYALSFSFRRLQRMPFVLVVGQAPEDYLQEWRREMEVSVALVLGFLLLSLVAGVFLHRATRRAWLESVRNKVFLQNASDGIQILDAHGHLIEVNDRFCSMLGFEREELLRMRTVDWARQWSDPFLHGELMPQLLGNTAPIALEAQLRRRDGSYLSAEINTRAFELSGKRYLYISARDIEDRKLAETRIQQLVHFDPLTKLANRRMLVDCLGKALLVSQRRQQFGAIVMLDIDNFKLLNDSEGHDAGDQLLIWLAQRLTAVLRTDDTVARTGGDEFVVLIEGLGADPLGATHQAELAAEKIRHVLDQRFKPEAMSNGFHCSCSVGVTLFKGLEASVDSILKQADLALYQAKGLGRNTVQFFNDHMQARVNMRASLESRMHDDFERGAFHLFYQSKHDASGRAVGAEALMRWFPAEHPPVSPAEFIPLAEDSGFILTLGLWVMQTACEQLALWAQDARFAHLQLAINVSAKQFHQPDFVDQLLACLKTSGANPRKLKLELTEGVVLKDVDEVVARIRQIKSQGVQFSLDDFGTGFSSLSYLKRLPFDEVKIDRSFVRELPENANDAAIVTAILRMGQSLGLQVCAEGVELETQAEFLRGERCDLYQGYLFARPVPLREFEEQVAARQHSSVAEPSDL